VLALSLFGGDDAFGIIDREKLYKWMLSLKHTNGGFHMHHGGEIDARYFISKTN
jgi:protein farnesyltransferase subunit beta